MTSSSRDIYFHTPSKIRQKSGSHITVMVPAVPAVVFKAEYDCGACVLSQVPSQSSILSAVPPVPYSQGKAISRVFGEVEFFIVRFQ